MRLKTKKPEFVVIVNNVPVLASLPSSTERIHINQRHTVILEGKEVRDGHLIARDIFAVIVKEWGKQVDVPKALIQKGVVLEDMEGENGEPLPCTKENKLGIYDSDDTMFVYQVLAAVYAKEKEIAEAEKGNSKPGPTGD